MKIHRIRLDAIRIASPQLWRAVDITVAPQRCECCQHSIRRVVTLVRLDASGCETGHERRVGLNCAAAILLMTTTQVVNAVRTYRLARRLPLSGGVKWFA